MEAKNKLIKKAVQMLLNGATLVSEPCPYCSGVRVIKDGYALCIKCGNEPQKNKKESIQTNDNININLDVITKILHKKLMLLFNEFELETNYEKQCSILDITNIILEILPKLKKFLC